MMKKSEVMQLLTLIASVERSGWVPSPEDATLWQAFAKVGQWESVEAAWQAYVVYRSKNPNYRINPGHITETLEGIRAKAGADFDPGSERPPDSIRDAANPDAAYLAWYKERAAQHRAAYMNRFAAGEIDTNAASRAIEA